jgi:SAM-dependent methyltransferase
MSGDFTDGYGDFKAYSTPRLKDKHVRQFDREFWQPTACTPSMTVLDAGCGTGNFLAYLSAKEVEDYLGIDRDPALADVIPETAAGHFQAVDVMGFVNGGAGERTFDRIVLFDVLEHFTAEDGVALLRGLSAILRDDGRILVKVPNMASPWGAQHQYGDLTHRAAYTPNSMRQLALAAGLDCLRCDRQISGSPPRRVLDGLLHGILDRVLMEPPEIWSANFFALLALRTG